MTVKRIYLIENIKSLTNNMKIEIFKVKLKKNVVMNGRVGGTLRYEI